jgi:excisionase family DNA binding protein
MENNDLLTIEEANEYVRLSVITLYKLRAKKQIPSTKLAGRVFFRRSKLQAWIDANSTEGKKAV